LPNNKITKLPAALSKLTRLINLDVSDNPIDDQHFDENILRDIGDTLLNLTFGGNALHKWPTALLMMGILTP
jgi:Leucine-rich repeat (LRR) protein